MKKRVDELLRETYVFEASEPVGSVSEVFVHLNANELYESRLFVSAGDKSRIRGIVYSDNRRIEIKTPQITGTSCEIKFTVDTYALKGGDVIKGKIFAETSNGELVIPVNAEVDEKTGTIGEDDDIKALEDFARSAQKDPKKAFRFFISEEFPQRVLNGKNVIYKALYRGLSKNPVTYQHMEEFLVSTGKKEPVSISVDKLDKNVYKINNSIKDTLYIYKSDWGYCHIDVSVTADFIEIEKHEIMASDFIGRIYGLEFIINKDRLSNRTRTGKIVLKTVYGELFVTIEASLDEGMRLISGTYRKKRLYSLARNYLDLLLKKTDYRTWYDTSKRLVDELKEEKKDGVTLFSEIFLAYCNEDDSKMVELLWYVKSGEYVPKEIWEKAAYLYLAKKAGLLPKEQTDIAPKLYAYYQQQSECFLLLDLYMQEDEAEPYRAVWGLSEYEKAYDLRCISPFLFLKAWKEYDKQESLLRSLSPFALRVLLFAQKEGILSKSLLLRAAFLAPNDKNFRPAVYKLLKEGYEKYPDRELLEAICRYIMKDDVTKPSYYYWYEKAVEYGLKMTRLYENYVQTRPETDESDFPHAVKVYFSYNHTLGARKKAYLFHCIIKNKQSDSVTYENYKNEMEKFAVESISAGHISTHLSTLYTEFIVKRKDLELLSALAKVVFTHRLTCNDPDIRRVVVCHPSLKDEAVYEMTNGVAYPNIYGPDACILLEDEKRRRFSSTVPFTLKSLMDIKRVAKACVDMGVWDTGLQLFCCHERGWQMEVNQRTVLSFLKAAENPEFTRSYRDRLREKLLLYFTKQPNDPYAPRFAEKIKEAVYGWVDKAKTLEILERCGENEKCMRLISKLGYEELSKDTLLKLASERAAAIEYAYKEDVLRLCTYLFKEGKYTERTLRYLSANFAGSLSDMENVWIRALAAKQDVKSIEEKILLTSMLIRQNSSYAEEILEDYARSKGNRTVIRTYLTFLSEYYILEDRKITSSTALRLKELCELKEKGTVFASLAWLKYQSEQDIIKDENKALIIRLMENFNLDGIRFAFMQKFKGELLGGMDISDRTFVEERFPTDSKVVIHYKMGNDEYKTEPLKQKVKGIFGREFLLFGNETLEYFCTVTYRGTETTTEKKQLFVTASKGDGNTRYHLINRILLASAAGDTDTAFKAAGDYLRQEALAEHFFEII